VHDGLPALIEFLAGAAVQQAILESKEDKTTDPDREHPGVRAGGPDDEPGR
jgi:hypothetical protein